MSNKMLDAALAYAKRGWAIFPCNFDKSPKTKHGVNDATTDPKQITKWWKQWPHANIGLNAGEAGFMILDLDPGHNLEELEKNVGPIPDTLLKASTPRNGRHLYFTLNDGEFVAASASRLAPCVDVRSFHSFVLLPPSATKDGKYTWLEEGKPAHRTDELIRVANSAGEKHKDRDVWFIDADLPENIEQCIKWLKGELNGHPCKVAIQGQGGDQVAYETAAMCKSYAISPELAFDLMWEHWNPRCMPPWSADEVDHFTLKIENGYHYNTSPPGNVTPAYRIAKSKEMFTKVEPELAGNEWRRGHFRGVDRARMALIKPPTWLIENFIPERGYALMFGAPESYKTFLALDIALSIAAGYPTNAVWDGKLNVCGPVCFVAGEGRAQILKRVRAWEMEHYGGHMVENFKLVDPVPNVAAEPDLFLALLEDISSHGFELVVLDTIGRAMQGVNENAQEHASAFTHLVERIQYEADTAVLALHHTGKGDTKTARGSSVFRADVDTEIRVEPKGMVVALEMTKQKDAAHWPKPKHIKLLEVHLSPEEKSLVAVPPSPEEKKSATNTEDLAILDVIEYETLRILKDDPLVAWSQSQLAETIALTETITVGSSQINQKYLKLLRETNERRAARCYIVVGKKRSWRWQT